MIGEQLIAELQQQRVLLTAILAELQSWRAPAGPVECPHPIEHQQDLSSMGERWVRCRLCKKDIVRMGGEST